MTTISPLSTSGFIGPLLAKSQATALSNASLAQSAVASPSTIVTLGQSSSVTDTPTYSFPSMAAAPIWEIASNDAVTQQMARNFSSQSLAGQFQGLGAALLDQLTTAGGNFSQSVMQPSSGTASSAATNTAMQAEMHSQTSNQITLDITTASGVKVGVTLGSQENGLAVQIQVSNGTLSDAERGAIEKLSGAFQSAINGLTANPPSLDLSGLMQYDPSALSSVSLHANVQLAGSGTQTVDFLANSQQRSITSSGPTGTIKLNVDTADLAMVGNAQQQSQAIASYMQQFNNASKLGNADASLMSMFKDAFTEMNSNYGTTATQASSAASHPISLSDFDHSLLSGLADFSASINQTSTSPNPMQPGETDTFSYQVSQSTTIKGSNQQNRSITQQQQSNLSASYHQALYPGTQLDLTDSLKSQNYYYYQIKDQANSQLAIAYSNGAASKASLNQSANQSTHTSKFVMGQLEEDTTLPSQASQSRDLLGLLKSIDQNGNSKSPQEANQRQQTLAALNKLIPLQADPTKLRNEKLP
jgi:hypothetical protein